MLAIACCLVEGLGLRLGLDLVSGWLVVDWLCTRICIAFHPRRHSTSTNVECRKRLSAEN